MEEPSMPISHWRLQLNGFSCSAWAYFTAVFVQSVKAFSLSGKNGGRKCWDPKYAAQKSLASDVIPVRIGDPLPCSVAACLNYTSVANVSFDLSFMQYRFSPICNECTKKPRPWIGFWSGFNSTICISILRGLCPVYHKILCRRSVGDLVRASKPYNLFFISKYC